MPCPPSSPRPRIALVLGSGGLKPLGAFPLFDFLASHGIRPDLLVGCSGGAATLALWSTGEWDTPRLQEAFHATMKPSVFTKDWRAILALLGVRKRSFTQDMGLFSKTPLMEVLQELYGQRRLEALDIPLVLQATDLQSGEGVELDSGDLAEAVYASCAAYPFLPPTRREGRWLFDGCFSAPVPILAAVRRGIDIVITLDFTSRLNPRPENLFKAMSHVTGILGQAVAQSQMLAALHMEGHEVIQVKVRFPMQIDIWEVDAFDRIMAAGHQAVEEYGQEILALARPPAALCSAREGA